jgi:hypothetical protein
MREIRVVRDRMARRVEQEGVLALYSSLEGRAGKLMARRRSPHPAALPRCLEARKAKRRALVDALPEPRAIQETHRMSVSVSCPCQSSLFALFAFRSSGWKTKPHLLRGVTDDSCLFLNPKGIESFSPRLARFQRAYLVRVSRHFLHFLPFDPAGGKRSPICSGGSQMTLACFSIPKGLNHSAQGWPDSRGPTLGVCHQVQQP